jgi:hypothetical protein
MKKLSVFSLLFASSLAAACGSEADPSRPHEVTNQGEPIVGNNCYADTADQAYTCPNVGQCSNFFPLASVVNGHTNCNPTLNVEVGNAALQGVDSQPLTFSTTISQTGGTSCNHAEVKVFGLLAGTANNWQLLHDSGDLPGTIARGVCSWPIQTFSHTYSHSGVNYADYRIVTGYYSGQLIGTHLNSITQVQGNHCSLPPDVCHSTCDNCCNGADRYGNCL